MKRREANLARLKKRHEELKKERKKLSTGLCLDDYVEKSGDSGDSENERKGVDGEKIKTAGQLREINLREKMDKLTNEEDAKQSEMHSLDNKIKRLYKEIESTEKEFEAAINQEQIENKILNQEVGNLRAVVLGEAQEDPSIKKLREYDFLNRTAPPLIFKKPEEARVPPLPLGMDFEGYAGKPAKEAKGDPAIRIIMVRKVKKDDVKDIGLELVERLKAKRVSLEKALGLFEDQIDEEGSTSDPRRAMRLSVVKSILKKYSFIFWI